MYFPSRITIGSSALKIMSPNCVPALTAGLPIWNMLRMIVEKPSVLMKSISFMMSCGRRRPPAYKAILGVFMMVIPLATYLTSSP
jgi:hypothetical protein